MTNTEIEKILKSEKNDIINDGTRCNKCGNEAIQSFISKCGVRYYHIKGRCENHKYKRKPHNYTELTSEQRLMYKTICNTRYFYNRLEDAIRGGLDCGIEEDEIINKVKKLIREIPIKEIIE